MASGHRAVDVTDLAARLADDRELIVAELAATAGELPAVVARADATRGALVERAVAARVVAFTSADVGEDVARLVRDQDAQLALTACPDELWRTGKPSTPPSPRWSGRRATSAYWRRGTASAPAAVTVLFGAAEHDWAAAERLAWVAVATEASPLCSAATQAPERVDASRTLATASLLLQRHLGVASSPLLAEAGPEGIVVGGRRRARRGRACRRWCDRRVLRLRRATRRRRCSSFGAATVRAA